ncbi:MAG: hypothetical protein M3Z85_14550, partial [Acidobacteriota bacterium]|nr:hypothetical protein [Acidobacteriota bacterium]
PAPTQMTTQIAANRPNMPVRADVNGLKLKGELEVLLPPEQKVRGSNPLGRTTRSVSDRERKSMKESKFIVSNLQEFVSNVACLAQCAPV